LTVSASTSTPRSSECRISSEKERILGMGVLSRRRPGVRERTPGRRAVGDAGGD
jgi:hypothetical protein